MKFRKSYGSIALLLGVISFTPLSAMAQPHDCDTMPNDTFGKITKCVTVEGVREHQKAFQEIADKYGDVRASGTPGYDESVEYVAKKMLVRMKADSEKVALILTFLAYFFSLFVNNLACAYQS